jgi:hypothetical protein
MRHTAAGRFIVFTIDLRMQSDATEKSSAIAQTILARTGGAGATT